MSVIYKSSNTNSKTIDNSGDIILKTSSSNSISLTKAIYDDKNSKITVWQKSKYILNTTNESAYYWYRSTTPNNGWGEGEPNTALSSLVTFDCTGFNYCRVKVKGNVESEPSGEIASHTGISIGFGTYSNAIEVVDKWTSTDEGNIGSGQVGKLDSSNSALGYTEFGEAILDISDLSGNQTLKMFCGGAYQNGGILYIKEIYLY